MLTIKPFGKRQNEANQLLLESDLARIVATEVLQDAKVKEESIKQLESQLLAKRSSFLKLHQRYEAMQKELQAQERRLTALKELSEKVLNHELSPAEIKTQLKQICS